MAPFRFFRTKEMASNAGMPVLSMSAIATSSGARPSPFAKNKYCNSLVPATQCTAMDSALSVGVVGVFCGEVTVVEGAAALSGNT